MHEMSIFMLRVCAISLTNEMNSLHLSALQYSRNKFPNNGMRLSISSLSLQMERRNERSTSSFFI